MAVRIIHHILYHPLFPVNFFIVPLYHNIRLISSYVFDIIIYIVTERNINMLSHTIHKRKYDVPIIIGISIVVLFIFSKNSWLYSTNDWVDANTFMTVGNAWAHGIIPYKDIFEQKGPLLYIIYGLAAKTGLWFHGIFILETVLMAISLWLLNKTFYLLSNNRFKNNITLIIYIIGFVFMPYFDRGGGVEELSTTAIVYLLYLVTLVSQKHEIQTHHIVICAILFTTVFWIKYTMILAYLILLGAYTAYLYLKKSSNMILKIIFINAIVFSLESAMILAYFFIKHAANSLFNVYFIDNIFKYSGNNLGNAAHPFITWALYFGSVLAIFIPIILLSILKKHDKLISNKLIFILITIVILNFMLSNNYRYYSLIVYPIIIYLLFVTNLHKTFLIGIMLALSVYVTINSKSIHETQFSSYQSPAQIFAKATHNSKNIVQVGVLDSGMYNLSQITPPTKYFHLNNINALLMPELINEPLRTITNKHPKYVLTTKYLYETKKSTAFKHYKLIKAFVPYNNKRMSYYILELKGN